MLEFQQGFLNFKHYYISGENWELDFSHQDGPRSTYGLTGMGNFIWSAFGKHVYNCRRTGSSCFEFNHSNLKILSLSYYFSSSCYLFFQLRNHQSANTQKVVGENNSNLHLQGNQNADKSAINMGAHHPSQTTQQSTNKWS